VRLSNRGLRAWKILAETGNINDGFGAFSVREGRIDLVARSSDGKALISTYGPPPPGGF
jgi:hypothetical protein